MEAASDIDEHKLIPLVALTNLNQYNDLDSFIAERVDVIIADGGDQLAMHETL